MKKIILICLCFCGCVSIKYIYNNTTPKTETKTYTIYDLGYAREKELNKIETIYKEGGYIEYKAKILGSGIKILNRIIEIEKKLNKEENK